MILAQGGRGWADSGAVRAVDVVRAVLLAIDMREAVRLRFRRLERLQSWLRKIPGCLNRLIDWLRSIIRRRQHSNRRWCRLRARW